MDWETFEVMWELSAPGDAAEKSFLRIPHTEYYCGEAPTPNPLQVMPDYENVPDSSLIPGATSGISFKTVTIDTPVYLSHLFSRFLGGGGSIFHGTVQHLHEVIEGGTCVFSQYPSPPVDAVVVCTGLGSRSLGGVEDKAVYPIRGQTVLLRAPWINFSRTVSDTRTGLCTYIIPRKSGNVLIGGTKVEDDWYSAPRPETAIDILKRCLALCPELAPPHIRAEREPKVDDLFPIIIENGCGLRPARKGGIRLEVEWFKAIKRNGKVPVVYNYGHGGYGFQSSWGSASLALGLLEGALAEME